MCFINCVNNSTNYVVSRFRNSFLCFWLVQNRLTSSDVNDQSFCISETASRHPGIKYICWLGGIYRCNLAPARWTDIIWHASWAKEKTVERYWISTKTIFKATVTAPLYCAALNISDLDQLESCRDGTTQNKVFFRKSKIVQNICFVTCYHLWRYPLVKWFCDPDILNISHSAKLPITVVTSYHKLYINRFYVQFVVYWSIDSSSHCFALLTVIHCYFVICC